jgi:hypothetical protein
VSLRLYVADGADSIHRHLINDMKLEASVASQCSSLDEFIDNLNETLFPDLAKEIEEEYVFNATSTRATLVKVHLGLMIYFGD